MSLKHIFIVITLLIIESTALASGTAADDISIKNPFARAVPDGIQNSGMFMEIHNAGSKTHAVVAATSDVSKVVELHEHANVGGMMRMRKINKIDIPAGGITILKPGGLHVMFIGLRSAMKEGSEVKVKLTFEDGSSTSIEAPIRHISAMGHKKMGHGKGGHKKHGGKHAMRHANPMPNLMRVVKKHGDQLALSDKQARDLKDWRMKNHERVHAIAQEVSDIEKAMLEASLNGKDKAMIMKMSETLMLKRAAIISTKTDCRDNLRRILNDEQYTKVIKLYRDHFIGMNDHH